MFVVLYVVGLCVWGVWIFGVMCGVVDVGFWCVC